MAISRQTGAAQPGFQWGPFTLRIPLVHFRISIPDLLQGFAVAGATGMALVPYFMALFALSFEEAIVMAMIHSMLISTAWMVFGEPYAGGWLTPAIPFVVAFITAPAYAGNPTAMFQVMTALSINFALILFVLGITGLGAKLQEIVPNVLKGGIILGAAIAAFLRVTKDGDVANVFQSAPIAGSLGVVVCLLFAFSKPLQAIAAQKAWLGKMLSYGLLPGFVVAGVVGYFTGEFTYNIRWELLNVFAVLGDVWAKASPFAIGWPSVEMYINAFPLALITYILFFGDLVTGNEMIAQAQPARPDEKLDINNSRTHLSTGIRNVVMGVMAPFFATQGVLWTGVQVILLKKWSAIKDPQNSFFENVGSFYLFGLPVLYILLPISTLLQPLLPVALAVTLILTAFACATLALAMVSDPTERGAMVITAMAFSLFEPWQGLLIGLASIIGLCGWRVFSPQAKPESTNE